MTSESAHMNAMPPVLLPVGSAWRAVLLRFGYDASACLLLALPLWHATVASAIGAFPSAAGLLHLDGGVWLLELLRTQQASLRASVVPGGLLLLLSSLALLPEWWLLRVLTRMAGAPCAELTQALPRLGVLALGTWALRALGWAAGISLALGVRSLLQRQPDERAADLAACAALAFTLLLQLGVSLLRDLAALRLVRRGHQRLLAELVRAARQLRARAAPLSAVYGSYRALSLAVLLGAHCLSVVLAQRSHDALSLLVVLLGLGLRVALEGLWLRWLVTSAGPAT